MINKKCKTLGKMLQNYFIEFMINQRHLSSRTVESYRDTFRLLLRYIDSNTKGDIASLKIEDLSANLILGFLDNIEIQRHNCARTRNARLAAIHSFMHYAALEEPEALACIQSVLAIPMKRYDKPLIGYLSQKEIRALIDAPDAQTWSGQRDRVMLETLYNTGARVSEVIAIKCGDIELGDSSSIRIMGKGRKERVLPLWKNTAKHLRLWISHNDLVATSYLFPNRFGRKLTRSGVENRMKAATKKASLNCRSLSNKKITPHLVRHTTAMHLLQSGVDISVISIWLGHESIATTHQYLEADLQMKAKALSKLNEPKHRLPKNMKPDKNDPFSFLDRL